MNVSKKVLFPLATLTAAGAIAIGSGATFTSTSDNTISSVTSGTLAQSNSKDKAAVFNLSNIKPGDVVNGTLTLTNTGSLPARFSLTEKSSSNAFSEDNLSLVITNTTAGKEVFRGTFGDLVDGAKTDIGVIEPKAVSTFKFSVALDQDAPNADQGKTAAATYQWDSIQLDGQTFEQ